MSRRLVITVDLDEAEEPLINALESVMFGMGYAYSGREFVKAEYNGELLISHDGEAPEELKSSNAYAEIMRMIQRDTEE